MPTFQSRSATLPPTSIPAQQKLIRVAWLFPSLEFGNYWHPVFSEFTQRYPQTTVYTGDWQGFTPGFEGRFSVKVVGKMRYLCFKHDKQGYQQGLIMASPAILGELWRDRPHVIFTSGFSMWTMMALLLKPLMRWRVIIAYDGSTPGVDYHKPCLRLLLRWLMGHVVDQFITNNQAGKTYLQHVLRVPLRRIMARPYQVPDVKTLLPKILPSSAPSACMTFLFAGQLIPRKGVHFLLEACRLLNEQGVQDYRLLIVGDGESRAELEAICQADRYQLLSAQVDWCGWVPYEQLGQYFQAADVFIFPTLEDVWGMVILEAMACGKPVFCSKYAGASELIVSQQNGHLFDPYVPATIADAMRWAIAHPDQIKQMGQNAQAVISQHTPRSVAAFLGDLVDQTVTRV